MSQKLQLLENASATGSYLNATGGRYIWAAEGTFSGATLQLQSKNANGTATSITGASLTAAGFVEVMVADGADLRVLITGSPSAMYSTLVTVGA